ncbi:MAG: hypothetical protein ACOVQ5_08695 [Flavobacteriales bacterium]|jgi:hypothetical protein
MKLLLLFITTLFFYHATAQNTSVTLSEIQQLTLLDQSVADNLLISKGFTLSNVSGLIFLYTKNTEKIEFSSTPRSITYTTLDANSYIQLNDAIAKEYTLLSAQDVLVSNGKNIAAVSFSKPGLKIALGTSSEGQTTFFIQSSTFSGSASLTAVETPRSNAAAKNLSSLIAPPPSTQDTSPIEGIPAKKTRLTFGAGLYRVPDMSTINGVREYDGYVETLYALNLGLEISKFPAMQKQKNFYVNTRIDINLTSFMDMQFSYQTTKPDDINYVTNLDILFLTKHYGTIGLISEIRKKNNSFLMCFAPGLNWNRGNFEGQKVNAFAGVIQMGEYYQRNFQSKSKQKDSMFMRFGFEQFFSFGQGYIGQFALTFGI